MYICICNAVTERQVTQAVKEGAGSMRELRHRLGVASECGRCAKCALDCLRAQQETCSPVQQDAMFDLIPEAA